MATGTITKAPDELPITLVNAVRVDLQLVPSSKRFLLVFYDSYTSSSNFHAYRVDFNGNAKTAKMEELANGGSPTTLMTFSVS